MLISCICVLFNYSYIMAQESLTLIVEVNNAKPNEGQIIISVFNSKKTFLKESYVSKTKAVDSNGQAFFEIIDLPTGIYSVSAIYDEDSDGELKTGFMGIPKELVGFSNNAKGTFGPPSFGKTAFNLNSNKTIKINLTNAKD